MKYFRTKAFKRDLIILAGLVLVKVLILPMIGG